MTYTPHQLRSALYEEYKFFAIEDPTMPHPDDYLMDIAPMLYDELVAETDTTDADDLDFYMQCWLPQSERG